MEKKEASGRSQQENSKPGCLTRISNGITKFLEGNFDRLGQSIGRHPWRYIVGCLVVVALCCLGLLRFSEVTDPDKLWVPDNAEILTQKAWIEKNFPSTTRVGFVMGVSSNVLTPTGLGALLDMYQEITTRNASGINIVDVCTKAGPNCIVQSVLELWKYDNTTIRALSQSDIISQVNSITTSPLYFTTINLATLLGQRTYDSNGKVTAASAALMTFLLQGSDDIKDTTEAWEEVFLAVGKAGHSGLTNTYTFAVRSFSDEAGGAIQGDVVSLSIGYFIVIFFVMLVLGKFNNMEQKVWLSFAGILCIGLSIAVSFGLSSAIGFEYGPLQSILPFLLLGIGVDDMFVIMGALVNLNPEEQAYDIPRKTGHVLRHAGVSVTVTSITDFVAFLIGATTVLPSLRSFCIYAAFGILALFFLQAIMFTACVSLDLRRQASRRNACCCCYTHPETYRSCSYSQMELIPLFFKRVMEPALAMLPVKIFVLVTTVALFGVNVWGFVELEQYFDRNLFLPSDSYAYDFLVTQEKYFPGDGADGAVYCGNLDYFSSQTKMDSVYNKFVGSPYIYNGTTDSWFESLTDWLETTSNTSGLLDANNYPLTEVDFVNLTVKLATQQETRHARNLQFSQSYGEDITASKIVYQHVYVKQTSEQIEILDATRQMVRDAGFSDSQCFPYAREYLSWETNRVIQEELYRNLGLACACVFLVTVILIAHIGTSIMVFFCVIFTLVDVAGSMHFWGLTIDTVTCIILIVAIGLAVDYSAHIGHMFMTVTGTRAERVKETIGEMGPPVFYGGFSTLLAFVLLANSNSYVFKTFFKVFLLVVLYGLFHGLLFLPVLLSWLGPEPYATADRSFHNVGDNRPSANQEMTVEAGTSATKETKPPSTNGFATTNNGFVGDGKLANGQTPYNAQLQRNGYPTRLSPLGNGNGSRLESGRASTPPPDYSPPGSPGAGRGLPRVQM
ncbi:patched domain-containing protein 3-like [Littorina saxatilis]|uniref:SSD domain-containing protein n=1 Tax=Littorina saxatilis TaxID=31220 RepID=A0AAN9B780_9CAEN